MGLRRDYAFLGHLLKSNHSMGSVNAKEKVIRICSKRCKLVEAANSKEKNPYAPQAIAPIEYRATDARKPRAGEIRGSERLGKPRRVHRA